MPVSIGDILVSNHVDAYSLTRRIDYYGVTFDHLVPPSDSDPDVLQINIIEIDSDQGAYANEHLAFDVEPAQYEKKVLAVLRCCQNRKGTQDRSRVNGEVKDRDTAATNH